MLRVTPLSAVLITHNEEGNLAAALESVRFCDEMLVVDSGSTDRTREIAEKAGARVIRNEPWPGFVAQRNLAADAAGNDWILAVDADERVSAELRDEIQAARAAGFDRPGYRIPRVAHYLGRWIRATDWYPDPQLRLFDRRKGRWQGGLVHESVRVDGSVGRLRSELEHHPYADIGHHLARSTVHHAWAREALAAGRRTARWTPWARRVAFCAHYLLKAGPGGRGRRTVSLLNAHNSRKRRRGS